MMTMRLLIATGLYPPEIGGPATYTALIEGELPNQGIMVKILPFRLVRFLPPGLRHFAYFCLCFLKALQADFVYAQDPVSVGLPAICAAKLARRRFVIRIAGDFAWEQAVQCFGVMEGINEFQHRKYGWQVELLRRIQKFVTNRADAVITPSRYFQQLVSGWVKDPKKVQLIYNGICLETQKYTNDKPKEKIIISAGRLVPWKGFDFLIEIMLDLPRWRLLIVGDGPECSRLKLKIKNLKLDDRVVLVGTVPREKLLQNLQQASLFVLNTTFESFSFQIVEAMHAGVPVVATKIGNIEEIIENGKEGILVTPNNREEFLMAINEINSDRKIREMIIQNAKEKAKQFSLQHTLEKLVRLLKRL